MKHTPSKPVNPSMKPKSKVKEIKKPDSLEKSGAKPMVETAESNFKFKSVGNIHQDHLPKAPIVKEVINDNGLRGQIQSVETIFYDFLKKKGYRSTPERALILKEIYAAPGHFDADEIFIKLKQKGGNISRATVYNTLDLLVECNLVSQNSFGHKHLHYERVYGYEHHDHIVCNECGEIFEFSSPEIETEQEKICRQLGFELQRHTLQMFCHCNKIDCEYKKNVSHAMMP
ncbi:MAG: transcriptional repressor [Chloroherpetonaceae bacterium]|nr:transcriptional repressor [Chloroherpetonaceae bacterium]